MAQKDEMFFPKSPNRASRHATAPEVERAGAGLNPSCKECVEKAALVLKYPSNVVLLNATLSSGKNVPRDVEVITMFIMRSQRWKVTADSLRSKLDTDLTSRAWLFVYTVVQSPWWSSVQSRG